MGRELSAQLASPSSRGRGHPSSDFASALSWGTVRAQKCRKHHEGKSFAEISRCRPPERDFQCSAELEPRWVGWLALDVERRVNGPGVGGQCVPVAEDLPEPQPKLMLLVRRGRAFDLGHVEVFSVPPSKVELWTLVDRGERYQPESKKKPLEEAPKEAKFVRESLAAINPRQIDPVSFNELKTVLNEHVASLLHFICHGAGNGFDSEIYLDDDEPLSADRLRGMASRELWIAAEPIVFLNACEVGRAEPGLAGGTGFARTMIELGARGVLAPLWTVKDTLAREVAEEVYTATLADADRSIAEILQDLRRRTYERPEAEDTYAAYCWFGDPATGLQI